MTEIWTRTGSKTQNSREQRLPAESLLVVALALLGWAGLLAGRARLGSAAGLNMTGRLRAGGDISSLHQHY